MCKFCKSFPPVSRRVSRRESMMGQGGTGNQRNSLMPLLEDSVKGYQAFKAKISELKDRYDKIYIVFTGSTEKNAPRMSWCPDCNDFYAVFAAFKMKHQIDGFLLYVDVGERDEWKNKASPFRTDTALKLTSIPTLMQWGTHKKLANGDILQESALELLFLEDE